MSAIPCLKGVSSENNSQSRTAKLYTSYLTVRGQLISFHDSGGVCDTVPRRLLRLDVFDRE